MITAVKILERKNLGDYSHRECELTATIDEGDDPNAVITATVAKASWYVQLPELESKYRKAKADLESEDAEVVARAKANIVRFEARKKYVESL